MVTMRDGVRLATDVHRPADKERHPVLVCRTPYDKRGPSVLIETREAVRRGYVVVVQDLRGRFASEGSFVPFFASEAEDGYDTVEWAAQQDWSDGSIGIFGASAMAVTAIQAAVAAPPHLKAVLAYSGAADLHDGWIYSSSVLELGFCLHWSLFSLRPAEAIRPDTRPDRKIQFAERVRNAQRDRWETIRSLPLDRLNVFTGGVAPQWEEWLTHPAYDEYWARIDASRRAAVIRAPILHATGWHDIFLKGHLSLHRALGNTTADSSHRLIIGPWEHLSHISESPTVIGERDVGPASVDGPALVPEVAFHWFDHWLKGEAIASSAPVRYFVIGSGEWRESSRWPPAHEDRRYYLHGAGHANSRLGDGRLSEEAPGDEPYDTFYYDPRDPVPSVGGRTLHPEWGPAGIYNQVPVESRDDVLLYSSEKLPDSLTLAGDISVVLYAATTGDDTDFTAKLVDVARDGYCANVAEGIARGRFRFGADRAVWVRRGAVERYVIDLWGVAHTFCAEHVIRVEISSSNFPRFSRNLNSRFSPESGTEPDVRVVRQEVWHDEGHPSHLLLPAAIPQAVGAGREAPG